VKSYVWFGKVWFGKVWFGMVWFVKEKKEKKDYEILPQKIGKKGKIEKNCKQ